MVALSPVLGDGDVRLMLNWNEKPNDMDLHILQVDKETGLKSCHTFWKYKTKCSGTGVMLDIDNKKGGLNGLETITLDNVEKNFQYTYMVWVDDYGGGGSTLKKSKWILNIHLFFLLQYDEANIKTNIKQAGGQDFRGPLWG